MGVRVRQRRVPRRRHRTRTAPGPAGTGRRARRSRTSPSTSSTSKKRRRQASVLGQLVAAGTAAAPAGSSAGTAVAAAHGARRVITPPRSGGGSGATPGRRCRAGAPAGRPPRPEPTGRQELQQHRRGEDEVDRTADQAAHHQRSAAGSATSPASGQPQRRAAAADGGAVAAPPRPRCASRGHHQPADGPEVERHDDGHDDDDVRPGHAPAAREAAAPRASRARASTIQTIWITRACAGPPDAHEEVGQQGDDDEHRAVAPRGSPEDRDRGVHTGCRTGCSDQRAPRARGSAR